MGIPEMYQLAAHKGSFSESENGEIIVALGDETFQAPADDFAGLIPNLRASYSTLANAYEVCRDDDGNIVDEELYSPEEVAKLEVKVTSIGHNLSNIAKLAN